MTSLDPHLQVHVCVLDADLHGQHLRRRVVLQEVSQVPQRGHQEARLVAVEPQLQEAVALGQRGVGGGAGAALQARTHLRTVRALDGPGAQLATGCEREETHRLQLASALSAQWSLRS